MMTPWPVTLEGERVVLRPLSPEDASDLWEIAREQKLWRWTLVRLETIDDVRQYIGEALRLAEAGLAFPFVVRDRKSGQAAGSTRYGAVERFHDRVEIGWTWIGSRWQGRGINTEMKFLMLQQAFEVMGCRRVEFKTDALNGHSRAALVKIGAVEEGVLRSHLLQWTGRARDTVYYSILRDEWPGVRARLLTRVARDLSKESSG